MKLILNCLAFVLIYNYSFAQIAISDIAYLENTPRFKEQEISMMEVMNKTLRYPLEMTAAPQVVTVLGVIKISEEGKIEDIGTLNKVDKSFRNQFIKFAKETEGLWETNGSPTKYIAVIPIVFSYDGADYSPNLKNIPDYFHDSKVIHFSSEIGNYENDNEYLEKVEKLADKAKYQKAVKIMEDLLSREPTNLEYYKKIIELNNRLNNAQEVQYYSELLRMLASRQMCKSI